MHSISKKCRKLAVAALSAAFLCNTVAMTASASEAYYCNSSIGAWLRSSPEVRSDNKLRVIGTNETVTVLDTSCGWGRVSYVDDYGNTWSGYTYMPNYSPVQDVTVPAAQPAVTDVPTQSVVPGANMDLFSLDDAGRWYYTVEPGDYLVKIMRRVNVPLDTLYDCNPDIQDRNLIHVGDRIYVTKSESVSLAPPPTAEAVQPVQEQAPQSLAVDYSGDNVSVIRSYLMNELSLNRAAAVAVITNLQAESGCDPTNWCIDTNMQISYGICQWNGPRYKALLHFCEQNGYDPAALRSQLEFLRYELSSCYNVQYQKMLMFPDTASGCYDASYYWASRFEVCSSKYWTGRAESAMAAY